MSEPTFKEINPCLRVGDDGSIWAKRIDRTNWRQLSIALKNGKPTVVIETDSGRVRRHVAALVLEAFVGPRLPGKKPIHKNGRKTDCQVGNLFWGERQRQCIFDEEVEADLEMLGDAGIGEVLRYFWAVGVSKKSVAESFEVEYRTVQYVIDNHSTPDRIKACGLDGKELQEVLGRIAS
jgi:hypothetical protein